MGTSFERQKRREKRRRRVRGTLMGTAERPRLCVFRSQKHVYGQLVDDTSGRVLAAVSSLSPEVRAEGGTNVGAAKRVGSLLAQRAKAVGIARAVFDRGGYRYHGRVAAFAVGAREAGMEF